LRHIYSLLLVMIGWVFFFSPGLGIAFGYLKVMFGAGAHGFIDKEGLYLFFTNAILWVVLGLGSTPLVHRAYERLLERKGQVRMAVGCILYGMMFLLCVAYLVTETYNPFLYFRF